MKMDILPYIMLSSADIENLLKCSLAMKLTYHSKLTKAINLKIYARVHLWWNYLEVRMNMEYFIEPKIIDSLKKY